MQSNSLSPLFKDWLNRCKITDQVIEEFGISDYNHPSIGLCISFPVYDGEGNILFHKYRRSPTDENKPKYLYETGSKVSLYGWHKAKDAQTILITEGEKDSLVAWSHNIPSVTSTGGAMSFQKEWAEFLHNKEVILCFDNDHAGGDGMVKALSIIPHAKILFLPDRPGVKDISDYVASGGDLHELLKTAVYFDGLSSVQGHRSERVALWKSTYFHDAYIKEHSKPIKKPYVRDEKIKDKILRAKQYPITDLLSFNYQNKAVCPFHAEKTPSLHYYDEDNRCYCFGGCGRSYDSIAIYQKKFNCSFKEAVQALQ